MRNVGRVFELYFMLQSVRCNIVETQENKRTKEANDA